MPGPKSYNNEMENTIQYELTPKKVKNIIIRVKANGVVAVTMPYRMSKKKVDAFVQSKAEWIRMMQKKLANQQRIDVDALEWNRQKEQYLRDILLQEYELFRAYHIFYANGQIPQHDQPLWKLLQGKGIHYFE